MVLDDVANRARLLVERGAALDAELLGDGDLHVVDELAVPDRLEDPVREAEHQHVLDGLLAQVVVDAEDLVLGERPRDRGVQRGARSSRSCPNGFSTTIRVQPAPRRLPTCSTISSKTLGGTAR